MFYCINLDYANDNFKFTRMENLLSKIIEETQDSDIKTIAESIASLDENPENMEQNLINDGLFILEVAHDNKD